MIDLMDDSKVAIKVESKSVHSIDSKSSEDVRDKMVRMLLDSINPEIPLLGAISENNRPKDLKLIFPMDVPHVLEWLHRYLHDFKCHDEKSKENVNILFADLRDVCFGKNGGLNNPE